MKTIKTVNQWINGKCDPENYEKYLEVRDKIWNMKQILLEEDSANASPSDYWRDELENFDYMWDATPLIIEKLRHHCFHITGLKNYDYRAHKDTTHRIINKRFRSLKGVSSDPSLIVPESPKLGGFGTPIDGCYYNIDSLKYSEVLIGLQQGGVFDSLKEKNSRHLFMEIGSGWGGFAYQLKKIIPNSGIVLVDFPELFLFAGTYLEILFPDAKVFYYGDIPLEQAFNNWDKYDFLFIPNSVWDKLPNAPVELAVNMVSFQEMTADQVRGYVSKLASMKCQYIYSLNRECSPYNPQMTKVSAVIGEHYSVKENDVLSTDYRAKEGKKKNKAVRNIFKSVINISKKPKDKAKGSAHKHTLGVLGRNTDKEKI